MLAEQMFIVPAEPGIKTKEGELIIAFMVKVTAHGKPYTYRVEPIIWVQE
jgi:hypothetical protein